MQANLNSLPQSQKDKLQSWLKDNQMDKLVEVLESKILSHEIEAANHLSEFVSESVERPGHQEEAKAAATKAVFYRQMINELITIRNQTEPLQTVNATPTRRKEIAP